MVPMGSKAFMPGQLIHTNEVLVLLGHNYFVERSAVQAKDIIKRRLAVIKDLIGKGEKSTQDLMARADFSEQAKKAALSSLGEEAKPINSSPAPKRPEEEKGEDDDDEEDDDDPKARISSFHTQVGSIRCFVLLIIAFWQTQEFWAAAGFVGAWGDEPVDEDEDEAEEKHPQKDTEQQSNTFSEFDDSEPVFEIREPVDGSGGILTKHDSQTAFEKSSSYPY
jgi:hypothetical protein